MRIDLHNHTIDHNQSSQKVLQKNIEAIYKTKILYEDLDGIAITNYHDVENALQLKEKFNDYIVVGCEYRVVEKNVPLHVVCLNITKKQHYTLMSARLRGIEHFTSLLKKKNITYYLTRVAWGTEINEEIVANLHLHLSCFYAINTANISTERESLFAQKIANYYNLSQVAGSDSLVSHYDCKIYTESKAKSFKEMLEDIKNGNTTIGVFVSPEKKKQKSWWHIGKNFYKDYIYSISSLDHTSPKIQKLKNTIDSKNFFEFISQTQHVYKLEQHAKKIQKLEKIYVDYLKLKTTEDILNSDLPIDEKKQIWIESIRQINHCF